MENLPDIKKEQELAVSSQMDQYVSFWLGSELFGVNIVDVKEVTVMLEVTPVFHAPPEVNGYVNLRGEIHLVLDLRVLLGMKPKEKQTDSMIVIFKTTVGDPFGIIVDRIGEVISVDPKDIEDQSSVNESSSHFKLSHGVCKLKEGLLVLLNARDFLAQTAPAQ